MKTYVKYSLIAWLLFTLLAGWVVFEISDHETALMRVISFVIPQMVLFYLNLLWMSCKFLEGKNKRLYYTILLSLVALHVICFAPIDIYMDQKFPLDLPHFEERPVFTIYLGRLFSSIPPLVISALIWKSLQLQKEREESLELKHQIAQAEAKALKAQINPHFFFNSMNNIYSLSQMKSDKTGEAILHLSEILRFVTYESEKERVSVHDELKQIKNFIELQLLKDEDNSNVHINIEENKANNQIAPMLLLPFIENSFKHSNFEDKKEGWIKINLEVGIKKLKLEINNSASLSSGKKDKTGGVGMENVKKRLSLIYPNRHSLHIKQDQLQYSVKLELDLNE